MSSHHFVRDGQEPALLIIEDLPFSLAGPLLEWVPLVIVHQQAAENVLSWGIKIDAILTTTPLYMQPQMQEQGPLEQLLISETDCDGIVTSLTYLGHRGHTAVNIMATLQPRWLNLPVQFPDLVINFLDANHRWTYSNRVYEKWLPANITLSLAAHQDLDYTVAGLNQHNQKQYISVSDGWVRITSSHGFWVGEPA